MAGLGQLAGGLVADAPVSAGDQRDGHVRSFRDGLARCAADHARGREAARVSAPAVLGVTGPGTRAPSRFTVEA